MLEMILIIVLAALVVALIVMTIIRHQRAKGTVSIKEEALSELIKAIVNNIQSGKIQDIAGKVSFILKNHLFCDRIVFLKYHRSFLELNYYSGIREFSRESFQIRLNPMLQNKLKTFHQIRSNSELKGVIADEYLRGIEALGMTSFFPVFLRENLYGLYFVRTSLPLTNPALQFLSTALAFNLSAAYHIGIQEQQIRRYEDRSRRILNDRQEKDVSTKNSEPTREFLRFLRIRNSRVLIPELLNLLRRDCEFSKMAFCVQSDSNNEAIFSVSWNVGAEVDRLLKENYAAIAGGMEADKIIDLKNVSVSESEMESRMRRLYENNIGYMMTIPWVDNKRAVLAWNGLRAAGDVQNRLKRFKLEALPLVENINQYEKVEELSYTDGLTEVYNFRYFQKRIQEEFTRAKRYGRSLALLILDIDDLKVVNDRFGHLAGDNLLKSFGAILTDSVRSNDVVCRYGGDEFCLIMPETDREKARHFMDRMREKIVASSPYLEDAEASLRYSVSIGGAVFPLDADSVEGLINAADMALLKAKSAGGNRSLLWESVAEPSRGD